MKKIMILTMVMVLVLSMGVTAFAVDPLVETSGGNGTTAVELQVAVTKFSVTVPMTLSISVDEMGVVTTASTAKIINNSFGKVKVTNVSITGANTWEIIPFDTVMATLPVNSKKLGFQLQTDKTIASGLDFKALSYSVMEGINGSGTDEIVLVYDAVVPAQSVLLGSTQVADIVFTLAWATE